jgi:hypothetical protein
VPHYQLLSPGLSLILGLLLVTGAWGQPPETDGLYGQTGVVYTPMAATAIDRRLTLGWQMIAAPLAHLSFSQRNGVGEHVFYGRLGFLPWLEASFRLLLPMQADGQYGIGDRSIFLKARLLRERTWLPAIAAGVYDPMGTRLLPASFLVASKHLPLGPRLLRASAGYGFPWPGEEGHILKGPWLSAEWLPAARPTGWQVQWSLGAELHRDQVNLSLTLHAFSFLRLQVWVAEARHPVWGGSGSFSL